MDYDVDLEKQRGGRTKLEYLSIDSAKKCNTTKIREIARRVEQLKRMNNHHVNSYYSDYSYSDYYKYSDHYADYDNIHK